MTDLDKIINDYVNLEQDVQGLMNRVCAPCCATCQNCCCRYDICEESLEAPFLCKVREYEAPSDVLSDSYGWLTPSGCALSAGRPPVCYEFLCDDLMHMLPNDETRYALRTLGMIITYVGRDAFGRTHLVEIMNPQHLSKVQYSRVQKRIATAYEALDDIRLILEQGHIMPPTPAMLKICTPDTNLFQGI